MRSFRTAGRTLAGAVVLVVVCGLGILPATGPEPAHAGSLSGTSSILAFTRTFPNAIANAVTSTFVAADSSTYAIGTFSTSITIGSTTLTSVGSSDVWMARYAENGTVLWAERFGTAGADDADAFTVDSSGNAYLASRGSSSATRLTVARFAAADGAVSTLTTLTGTATLSRVDLTLSGGGLFLAYATDGQHTIGALSVGTPANETASVVKLTTTGLALVKRTATIGDATGVDIGHAIEPMPNGGVAWVIPTAGGPTTVGSTTVPAATLGTAVALADNLTVQWAQPVPGSTSDDIAGLATDAGGQIVIGASIIGATTFAGTTLSPVGPASGALMAFTATGEQQWGRTLNSSAGLYLTSIESRPTGSILLGGNYSGTTAFDGIGLTTALSTFEGWVGEVSGGGSPLWAEKVASGIGYRVRHVTGNTAGRVAFGREYTTATTLLTSTVPAAPGGNSTDGYLGVIHRPPSDVYPVGDFTPLAPARILDSRNGQLPGGFTTPWGPGMVRDLPILSHGGVPLGLANGSVTAVVLNVTVTQPTAASHLTIWPKGYARPTTSSLNMKAGQTVANLVTVRVGPGTFGPISIFNNAGNVHVIADVVGYYSNSDSGARFSPSTPTRLIDTRTDVGLTGPLVAGTARTKVVAGQAGVAADATAVVLNLTAINSSVDSHITVWPTGSTKPEASNLNFPANTVVPNLVIAKLGTNGSMTLATNSGTVNVLADVVGWFSDSCCSARFTPLVPTRVFDSRNGQGGAGGPLAAGVARTAAVGGTAGIPADAKAVIANVTVTGPTATSHLTVYPAGESLPVASTLNYSAGQTVPNAVMVKLGTGGRLSLRNNSGTAHVIVDVVGYLR